jgi:hypothetical protein
MFCFLHFFDKKSKVFEIWFTYFEFKAYFAGSKSKK